MFIFCCSRLNNGPTKVSYPSLLEPVTTLPYIEGLYKCDKDLEKEIIMDCPYKREMDESETQRRQYDDRSGEIFEVLAAGFEDEQRGHDTGMQADS